MFDRVAQKRIRRCSMVALLATFSFQATLALITYRISLGHALPNIPEERISGSSKAEVANTGSNKSWTHKYNIEFGGSVDIDLILNFRLRDSVTQSQLNAVGWTWINTANATWDNQFVLVHDDRYRYPIRVEWEQSLTNEHFTINVHDDQPRANMTNWDITSSGRTAAHEFGHMLGPFDEYDADGWQDRDLACCPGFNDSTSIMGAGTQAKVRHATQFVLEQWAALSDIQPRVPGGVDVVQSLSNFSVVNTTGQVASTFSLRLENVQADEILQTFQAPGTQVSLAEDELGTTIHWLGPVISAGGSGRFGVELEEGVNANAASANWNGNDAATGLGVQQYWAGDITSPSHIGSTIHNTSTEPLFVSRRFSYELTDPFSLKELDRDLPIDWQNEFTTPTALLPGEDLYDTFDISPDSSIVSQVRVFRQDDLVNPIADFTNQGIGRELFTDYALAPGDFDLNNFWEPADLPLMQTAFADPDGFMIQNGLSSFEFMTLSDLDRDGDFDQTDINLANLWVPRLDEDGPTFPADLDDDGVITTADIDALTEEINDGTNNPDFDLNGDGLVTDSDREYWVEHIMGTRFGDLDLDGRVTISDDESTLLANLNMPGVFGWLDGDLDGDQLVTELDHELLLASLGFEIGPPTMVQEYAVIPEPWSATLAELAFGLLLGGHHYRRKLRLKTRSPSGVEDI